MSESESVYDLLIIGAGINGAALARLASRNNIKVLVVEKHDIAKGASSASSKLIHGGLRYLEQRDIPLVSESIAERKVLKDTAPHLVTTSPFLFPQTEHNRHPKFLARLGLWMYKNLSKKHPIGKYHPYYSSEELTQKEPLFTPNKNNGSLNYLDCQMDDCRMVVENIIDAKKHHAEIKTYTEFLSSTFENETHTVELSDRLTQFKFKVKAKKIAYCTGPWTDTILEQKERPSVLLQSQGTHLFVENLKVDHSFILPVPKSKRFFFVLPWLHGTLVGTTESKPPIHPDLCIPTKEEVVELSNLIGLYFPNSKPQGICTFAGIRPLAKSRATNSIKASRKHKCLNMGNQEYAIIGGKFTTHRLMVEDLFLIMGFDLNESLENSLYPGAKDYKSHADLKTLLASRLNHFSDCTEEHLERITKTYGTNALNISSEGDSLIYNEASYCQKSENCRSPIDFLRRRSNLFFNCGAGLEHFDKIESIFENSPKAVEGNWKDLYLKLLKDSNHAAVKDRS